MLGLEYPTMPLHSRRSSRNPSSVSLVQHPTEYVMATVSIWKASPASTFVKCNNNGTQPLLALHLSYTLHPPAALQCKTAAIREVKDKGWDFLKCSM